MENRDFGAVSHILKYCRQISSTSNEFDNSKEKFLESATFRNAICLCILQIGELSAILSDGFKNKNADIPWRDIKLLRNIIAHRYGRIDFEIIWEILVNDIPIITGFCEKIINSRTEAVNRQPMTKFAESE